MQWVSPSDWTIPCDNRTVPRPGSPDLLPATGASNTLSLACWAQRQPWGAPPGIPQQDQALPRRGLPQEGKHPDMFPAGLIAPPANITARWAGAAGQICVSWQPPLADFPNFFLYEVQCCPASSPGMPCSTTLNPSDPSIQSTVSTHTPRAGAASPGAGQVHRGVRDGQGGLRAAAAPQPGSSLQRLVQANTWVVLRGLLPGMRYHIQVRSKPDGTSLDGIWGPWSQAVAAETPHSSGEQPSPLQGCWQEQQGGILGLQGVGVLL